MYKHVNDEGITYYLHTDGTLFWFSRNKTGKGRIVTMLPAHLKVIENPVTGMPMVKRR